MPRICSVIPGAVNLVAIGLEVFPRLSLVSFIAADKTVSNLRLIAAGAYIAMERELSRFGFEKIFFIDRL